MNNKTRSRGGGGGCYVDFRETNTPIDSILIKKNNWQILMQDDYKSVRYNLSYEIELLDENESLDCWSYLTPYAERQVIINYAKYPSGTLKSRIDPYEKDASKTVIYIYFDKALNKENKTVNFEFSFTVPIESTIVKETTKTIVTFYDWIIHDCKNDKLNVDIRLPKKAQIVNFIPQTKPPIVHNPVKFDSVNIPANGLFSFMLSFQENKLGFKFWSLVISIIASGILGGLISMFFNHSA